MSDLNALAPILSNPMVLGPLITVGLNTVVKPIFQHIDDGKYVDHYAQYMHPAVLVLSFLASAVDLASKHQLHSVDMTMLENFLKFYLPTLVSAKAMTVKAKPAETKPVKLTPKVVVVKK